MEVSAGLHSCKGIRGRVPFLTFSAPDVWLHSWAQDSMPAITMTLPTTDCFSCFTLIRTAVITLDSGLFPHLKTPHYNWESLLMCKENYSWDPEITTCTCFFFLFSKVLGVLLFSKHGSACNKTSQAAG